MWDWIKKNKWYITAAVVVLVACVVTGGAAAVLHASAAGVKEVTVYGLTVTAKAAIATVRVVPAVAACVSASAVSKQHQEVTAAKEIIAQKKLDETQEALDKEKLDNKEKDAKLVILNARIDALERAQQARNERNSQDQLAAETQQAQAANTTSAEHQANAIDQAAQFRPQPRHTDKPETSVNTTGASSSIFASAARQASTTQSGGAIPAQASSAAQDKPAAPDTTRTATVDTERGGLHRRRPPGRSRKSAQDNGAGVFPQGNKSDHDFRP